MNKPDILNRLELESVVGFTLNQNKSLLNVHERCDFCFVVDLNKQEVQELIKALQEIENQMI